MSLPQTGVGVGVGSGVAVAAGVSVGVGTGAVAVATNVGVATGVAPIGQNGSRSVRPTRPKRYSASGICAVGGGSSPRTTQNGALGDDRRPLPVNAAVTYRRAVGARSRTDSIESGISREPHPKSIETPLSPERRTALRNELIAETPSWYVPWVHLFVPSMIGVAIIVIAVTHIRELRPVELLTVPLVYLYGNAFEWWIHGNALHRRNPLAPLLYEQHTPKHHMLYLTEDMAMRDTREYRLVLIPAYGLLLIFVGQLGATSVLWWLGLRNVACLYAATAIGYAVSYEWLHFSYHLPHEHPIAKNPIVLRLARHHAVHHDPRLMQRYNLNVTVPLMDHVMGTAVDSVESANRLRSRPQ